MAANVIFDTAHLLVHPLPIFGAALLLRSAVCIMVAIGVGWARVLYGIFAALTILSELFSLACGFVATGKYGSHGDLRRTHLLVALASIHLLLSIWTLWLLASSESVGEFFHRGKF